MPLNGKSLETGLVVNQKFLDIVKDKPTQNTLVGVFCLVQIPQIKKCLTSGGNNVDPFLISDLISWAKLLK